METYTLPLPSLLSLLGAFVGSAFALIRYVFAQHRQTIDRFVTFLEGALARQEGINADFRFSITELSDSVRGQSRLLTRISERMGIT